MIKSCYKKKFICIFYINCFKKVFAKQYYIMILVTFKVHHTSNYEWTQIEACKNKNFTKPHQNKRTNLLLRSLKLLLSEGAKNFLPPELISPFKRTLGFGVKLCCLEAEWLAVIFLSEQNLIGVVLLLRSLMISSISLSQPLKSSCGFHLNKPADWRLVPMLTNSEGLVTKRLTFLTALDQLLRDSEFLMKLLELFLFSDWGAWEEVTGSQRGVALNKLISFLLKIKSFMQSVNEHSNLQT